MNPSKASLVALAYIMDENIYEKTISKEMIEVMKFLNAALNVTKASIASIDLVYLRDGLTRTELNPVRINIQQ